MADQTFLRITREGYDTIAQYYADYFQNELDDKPLERAMLAAFAEIADGRGPVADVGSGPGRVTARLAELGLPAFGVDLSPTMVAIAREEHPHLRFEEGSMTGLNLGDNELGGLLAWYSIIHVPPERLAEVFTEFHRVLSPGSPLLLAFQVGDEPLELTNTAGFTFSLTFHRLRPERIEDLLRAHGFAMDARLVREPGGFGTESTPQAFLLAHKDSAHEGP